MFNFCVFVVEVFFLIFWRGVGDVFFPFFAFSCMFLACYACTLRYACACICSFWCALAGYASSYPNDLDLMVGCFQGIQECSRIGTRNCVDYGNGVTYTHMTGV